MEVSATPADEVRDEAREEARRIVKFWRERGWLSRTSAPLHIHPLDLTKLEELIAEAILGRR